MRLSTVSAALAVVVLLAVPGHAGSNCADLNEGVCTMQGALIGFYMYTGECHTSCEEAPATGSCCEYKQMQCRLGASTSISQSPSPFSTGACSPSTRRLRSEEVGALPTVETQPRRLNDNYTFDPTPYGGWPAPTDPSYSLYMSCGEACQSLYTTPDGRWLSVYKFDLCLSWCINDMQLQGAFPLQRAGVARKTAKAAAAPVATWGDPAHGFASGLAAGALLAVLALVVERRQLLAAAARAPAGGKEEQSSPSIEMTEL